ncbi:pyruvate kinase-like protein [Podospora appendiculata]|uniref:Pyruvate kinase-like protein n=1 Tax=Podospora appendiculata TaxID=314037 RepID=A0AAE0X6M9_9PEZI|nr:pyruvate kinase-like protein [Podospora appendiculata]
MAQDPEVNLDAPFTSDVVLEVRTGKLKPLAGIKANSAIYKDVCDGPVPVTKMGLEGDEHDYTFHGGLEKAVHSYCSSHYAIWRDEFPDSAEHFVPGGFGENLVTARMNEKNVCIGDVVAVGDEVLLQVSLPRQPCFKLNHRFQVKTLAVQTWKKSRTGWYYRVLQPGSIKAGDQIRLVQRKNPQWTIWRVQEFLHRKENDNAMNEELAGIEELGTEARDQFKGRVARQKAKERKAQAEKNAPKWRDFKVVEKKQQTPRIMSFVLEAVEQRTDPDEVELWSGAHAKIKLGNGLVRAYSLVDGDKNRFQLGIALEENSRGGSKHMHEQVKVGDVLQVGAMTEAIAFQGAASEHIFVVGGIGVTAFLSLIEFFKKINYSAVMHYAVRSAAEIPFRERIEALGDYVVIYDKSAGQRLDIPSIVKNRTWNSHMYFCGPKSLMEEGKRETKAHFMPEKEVHFEAFEADVSGDPFEAVVANKGGKVLKIGEDETLLEILQREFQDVASSCSVGNCGTCRVGVTGGRVDHRGTALDEDDKATSMLACVSRGIGRITIEI